MNLRRNRHKGHVAVEAGSLSDILFFLMLFFLIVSTLASPTAIKLLLPKSTTGKSVPKGIINLSVTEDLRYYIDKVEVNPSNLEGQLKAIAQNTNNPTVVLRCDKSVTVENLVAVVDAVNKASLPMVIATEKSK